jgi:hypothetical protein
VEGAGLMAFLSKMCKKIVAITGWVLDSNGKNPIMKSKSGGHSGQIKEYGF